MFRHAKSPEQCDSHTAVPRRLLGGEFLKKRRCVQERGRCGGQGIRDLCLGEVKEIPKITGKTTSGITRKSRAREYLPSLRQMMKGLKEKWSGKFIITACAWVHHEEINRLAEFRDCSVIAAQKTTYMKGRGEATKLGRRKRVSCKEGSGTGAHSVPQSTAKIMQRLNTDSARNHQKIEVARRRKTVTSVCLYACGLTAGWGTRVSKFPHSLGIKVIISKFVKHNHETYFISSLRCHLVKGSVLFYVLLKRKKKKSQLNYDMQSLLRPKGPKTSEVLTWKGEKDGWFRNRVNSTRKSWTSSNGLPAWSGNPGGEECGTWSLLSL